MQVADFYYMEIGLLFGAAVSVGLTAVALNRPAYRMARRCALAATILFASIAVMWGVTTVETAWIRIPAVGLAGLIAAICLTEALRFIKDREGTVAPSAPTARAENDPSTVANPAGVTSNGLFGRSTIENVAIEGPWSTGIAIDGSRDNSMTNVKIRGAQHGITMKNTGKNEFKDIDIDLNKGQPKPAD
jgi:hypothetical protein